MAPTRARIGIRGRESSGRKIVVEVATVDGSEPACKKRGERREPFSGFVNYSTVGRKVLT